MAGQTGRNGILTLFWMPNLFGVRASFHFKSNHVIRFTTLSAYTSALTLDEFEYQVNEKMDEIEHHTLGGGEVLSVQIACCGEKYFATITWDDTQGEPAPYSFWERIKILFTGKPY
jgi:hypothetical protein